MNIIITLEALRLETSTYAGAPAKFLQMALSNNGKKYF